MADVPLTYVFEASDTLPQQRPHFLREYADNGARYMTLSTRLVRHIIGNAEMANVFQKEISDVGMSFVDSHAPYNDPECLNTMNPRYRPAMIDRLRLAIRVAADMGVGVITVHTGSAKGFNQSFTLDQLHQAAIATLEEALPLAVELKVTISVENLRHPTATPERLIDICRHFDSPYLGICFDAGHANLMKCERGLTEGSVIGVWEGQEKILWDDKILEKVLPYITTCHVQDNHGQYDEHLAPGKGEIDWAHVVSQLKTAPRLKSVLCEVIPFKAGHSISGICQSMRNLWGRTS